MQHCGRIKTAKLGYIITSLIFCAAGLLLIFYPQLSAQTLCYLVGGLLIACGVIKVIGYFSKDLYRLAFQFDLASGLLSAAIGIVMVLHPSAVIGIMHFVIGILALVDAFFKLQTALDAKRFGIAQWWAIGLLAMLAAALGLLLIINPFAGAKVIMVAAGVTLVLEGALNLCVVLYAVQVFRRDISPADEPEERWKDEDR